MISTTAFVSCLVLAGYFHLSEPCISGAGPCKIRNVKPIPATGVKGLNPKQCDADGEGQVCKLPEDESFHIKAGACPAEIFLDQYAFPIPHGGIKCACNGGNIRCTGDGLDKDEVDEISCSRNPCTIVNRKPLPASGVNGLNPTECRHTGAGSASGQRCTLDNGEYYNVEAGACVDNGDRLFLNAAGGAIIDPIPAAGVNFICRKDGSVDAIDAGTGNQIEAGVTEVACGFQTCDILTSRPLPAAGQTGLRADVCTSSAIPAPPASFGGIGQLCTLNEGSQFTIPPSGCMKEGVQLQLFLNAPGGGAFDVVSGGANFQCREGSVVTALNGGVPAVDVLTCGWCQAAVPDTQEGEIFGTTLPNGGCANGLCNFNGADAEGTVAAVCPADLGRWTILQETGQRTSFDPSIAGINNLIDIDGPIRAQCIGDGGSVDVTVTTTAGAEITFKNVVSIFCGDP